MKKLTIAIFIILIVSLGVNALVIIQNNQLAIKTKEFERKIDENNTLISKLQFDLNEIKAIYRKGYIFFKVDFNQELKEELIQKLSTDENVSIKNYISETDAYNTYVEQSNGEILTALLAMQNKKLPSSYELSFLSDNDMINKSSELQMRSVIDDFSKTHSLENDAVTIALPTY